MPCKGDSEITDAKSVRPFGEEPSRLKKAKLDSSTGTAVLTPVVTTSACHEGTLTTISQSVCNTSMDETADGKQTSDMETVQSGEVFPMDMSVVIGQLQILFVHLLSSNRRLDIYWC